jgi:MoaA/NifB/PqqE/SkfB family radical SAM enzyme
MFIKITGEVLACPGETEPVGNLTLEPLTEIWERLRPAREAFDGGCPPRERFWAKLLADAAMEPAASRA